MKTILIYILVYISVAHIRADVGPIKTFSCKSSYSMFNRSFEQGDELFVDIYINENGNIDVKAAQLYGNEYNVILDKSFRIGESRTAFSTSNTDGAYLSMVFLGKDNWGLYLKSKAGSGSHFLPDEVELMCKQIDFSVI